MLGIVLRIVVLSLSLLLFATIAFGDPGIPDLPLSIAEFTNYTGGGTLVVRCLPDGSGAGFEDAHVMNQAGGLQDGRITVTIIASDGSRVVAFPWEDVWLESAGAGGTLASCLVPTHPVIHADPVQSDLQGRMWFSGARAAGGWTDGGSRVYLMGAALPIPDLAIRFVSPDIDGNLVVNLSDTGFFSTDLFGTYHIRSDLNADGTIDLSDSGFLATALGNHCLAK